MKSLRVSLSVLLFLLLPGMATAQEDPYRETALAFVGEMVRLFPPAEGFVVSLPEGQVYVDLAEAQLMRPGMELIVYRDGEPIVHPVTGDVLGRYETEVGHLVVKEVHEKYSVAAAVGSPGEMRPGDRVRISARPLQSLLLFLSESPGLETGRLAGELRGAAEESGRFRLSDEPEWLPRLKEEGLTIEEATAGEKELRDLGRRLRADLLIMVSPMKEGRASLDVDVVSLWTGRTLAGLSRPWEGAPREAAAPTRETSALSRIFGGAAESPAPRREYTAKSMPGGILCLVVGDFTGGGATEVLTSDGRGLTLYGWEGGGLLWKWEDKGPAGRRVLNLEGADLDGDGSLEVLFTTVAGGRLATEVLSWERGEWGVLRKEEGRYFRVLEAAPGRRRIFGQRAGVTTVFSGPVREYRWVEGAFLEQEGAVLPEGVDIFGLGLVDVDGDGEAETLSLSDEGRIRVYDGEGGKIWEGGERYGGYPARVTPDDLFGPRLAGGGPGGGILRESTVSEQSGKDTERDILTAFQGRILGVTQGGGAAGVVVLPSNLSGVGRILPNMRRFEKGAVALLRWEEGRLVEVSRSRLQEGYIADIATADVDGDGRQEIFMAVDEAGGILSGPKGSLVLWDPPEGAAAPSGDK